MKREENAIILLFSATIGLLNLSYATADLHTLCKLSPGHIQVLTKLNFQDIQDIQ